MTLVTSSLAAKVTLQPIGSSGSSSKDWSATRAWRGAVISLSNLKFISAGRRSPTVSALVGSLFPKRELSAGNEDTFGGCPIALVPTHAAIIRWLLAISVEQTRDFKHALDCSAHTFDQQAAAQGAEFVAGGDDRSKAGRVDELDRTRVEHDDRGTSFDQRVECGFELGRCLDVDFTCRSDAERVLRRVAGSDRERVNRQSFALLHESTP